MGATSAQFITGESVGWILLTFAALIFYYGAVLASSNNYSVQDILTVFAMLLFSIANAANMIAFSKFNQSSSKDIHY